MKSETKVPITAWSIKCPCGECDEFLGLQLGTSEGDEVLAMPVFDSRLDAEKFLSEWAKSKLPRKRIRMMQRKLIRPVPPGQIPDDRTIRCPDGHLHSWGEWYASVTAEGN